MIFSYLVSAATTQAGTGNTAFLFIKLISYSFVFLIILAAAYFTTRYVGKKSAAVLGGRNIQIIEKVVLGLDKTLFIVKVGEHYYLLAAGKQNIVLLTEVSKEEIKLSQKEAHGMDVFPNFDSYLKKFTRKQPEDLQDHEILPYHAQDNLQKIFSEFKIRNQNANMFSDKDEQE